MGILHSIFGTLALLLLSGSSLAELKECFAWNCPKFNNISENDYNCSNNQITGISTKTDKYVFFSIPRDKSRDVPCTLAYVNISTKLGKCKSATSPKLSCYPSFSANQVDANNCENIISVHRSMKVDKCKRLWVLDSGIVGPDYSQICPPRIHVIDLTTHQKLRMFTLPSSVLAPSSCDPTPIYSDLSVDSGDTCDDVYCYMVDRIGLIVYSWEENDAWRFEHPYFRPDPLQGTFDYGSIRVQKLDDGIHSIALSAVNSDGHKTLYFQPFTSTKEFSVSTSLLKNKTACLNNDYYYNFTYIGDRGCLGMSAFVTIAKHTGTMFFGAVSFNSTMCWNTEKPYNPSYFHTIATFPGYPEHAIVDGNEVLCVLMNKNPQFENDKMDYSKRVKNYIVSCGKVSGLIKGTVCE